MHLFFCFVELQIENSNKLEHKTLIEKSWKKRFIFEFGSSFCYVASLTIISNSAIEIKSNVVVAYNLNSAWTNYDLPFKIQRNSDLLWMLIKFQPFRCFTSSHYLNKLSQIVHFKLFLTLVFYTMHPIYVLVFFFIVFHFIRFVTSFCWNKYWTIKRCSLAR